MWLKESSYIQYISVDKKLALMSKVFGIKKCYIVNKNSHDTCPLKIIRISLRCWYFSNVSVNSIKLLEH